MTEALFQISNALVLPFWLLMIVLPHWRWTQRIIGSPWIAAPTALIYAILVLPSIATLLPALAQPTLASVTALLGTPEAAAIAWAHFLTFDLLAGRWAYLDSRTRRISAWLMAPVLLLIFLLGPLGFLLYLLVRAAASLAAGRGPAIAG
jgi:ABA DEFICIENT 4-like